MVAYKLTDNTFTVRPDMIPKGFFMVITNVLEEHDGKRRCQHRGRVVEKQYLASGGLSLIVGLAPSRLFGPVNPAPGQGVHGSGGVVRTPARGSAVMIAVPCLTWISWG